MEIEKLKKEIEAIKTLNKENKKRMNNQSEVSYIVVNQMAMLMKFVR